MHYSNQMQMRAMYSYINANIPSSVLAYKPKHEHLVERANERDYDTSLVTKVIIQGINQYTDYFENRVRDCKHTLAFIHNELTVVGVAFRNNDGKLGFSFRTCFYSEKVTQSVVHKLKITM